MSAWGDEDDNPFANEVSPWAATSTYQTTTSSSTGGGFGRDPPSPEAFTSVSPFDDALPRMSMPSSMYEPPPSTSTSTMATGIGSGFLNASSSGSTSAILAPPEDRYGPPLATPTLTPSEDRPSPYVAALSGSSAPSSRAVDDDDDDRGFGGSSWGAAAARKEPSYSSSFSAVSPLPPPRAISPPPAVVDLHTLEDHAILSGGVSAAQADPLAGLLGESEEDKLKSAFKKSEFRKSEFRKTPAKPKVKKQTQQQLKEEREEERKKKQAAEAASAAASPAAATETKEVETSSAAISSGDASSKKEEEQAKVEEQEQTKTEKSSNEDNDATPSKGDIDTTTTAAASSTPETSEDAASPAPVAPPSASTETEDVTPASKPPSDNGLNASETLPSSSSPSQTPLPPSKPPTPAPVPPSTEDKPDSVEPTQETRVEPAASEHPSSPRPPKPQSASEELEPEPEPEYERPLAPVVLSPLDAPSVSSVADPSFEHSFSSLALGGVATSSGWGASEQTGGWSSARGSTNSGGEWGGETSANEPEVLGGTSSGFSEQSREFSTGGEEEREEIDSDDKPLALSHPNASSQGPRPPAKMGSTSNKPPRAFLIRIGDPTKVGLAAAAHIVYTVTVRTLAPHLAGRQDISVLRRFSDFLWLFNVLQASNPGVIVPPVPDKHPFGRFADDFVETRRGALERCLQKIADHPVLQLDPDLRLFLESDAFHLEMKQRSAELAAEQRGGAGGVSGVAGGYLTSLTSTLTGPKFVEYDDWFNQKKLVLDTLESQLKVLVKSIELVSKQRLELAAATSDFSEAIAALAGADLSEPLAHALERFAEIARKSRDVQEENAKGDVRTFMGTADEYIRLIASVRLAFASRVKTHLAARLLSSEAQKQRVNLEKARRANKVPSDRLGPEIALVGETERRAKAAQAEADSVSRLVKVEYARFEGERVEDFKDALEGFLDGLMEKQKILISAYEEYHGIMLRLVQRGEMRLQQQVQQQQQSSPVHSGPSAGLESHEASAAMASADDEEENAWA